MTTAGLRQFLSRRVSLKNGISRGAAATYGLARRSGVAGSFDLRTTTYRPHVPNWPRDLSIRIVALADFHFGSPYLDAERLGRIIREATALRPDLIVLLGDYGASGMVVEAHRLAMKKLADELERLSAPLGVFAITGNHDWWDDPVAQRAGRGPVVAAQELSRVGIAVLENEAIRVERGGRAFWVAGLADQWALLGPPTRGVDDLPLLTSRLTDDAPAILLAHEPDIFPEVSERYALTLSGHTHGGQIRLFGRTPIVPSKFGSRYVHGHIVEHGRHLIVSAGLGVSIAPLRIGVPPEIVVIELGALSSGANPFGALRQAQGA